MSLSPKPARAQTETQVSKTRGEDDVWDEVEAEDVKEEAGDETKGTKR